MSKTSKIAPLIKIPQIFDDCFLFIAESSHIPFPIKRVFFITKASPKQSRGFHAHKKTRVIIFCIQETLRITLNDGKKKENIILSRPDIGVIIEPMIWHEMHDYKPNTIQLVIASTTFDEKDYIRDYQVYLQMVNRKK